METETVERIHFIFSFQFCIILIAGCCACTSKLSKQDEAVIDNVIRLADAVAEMHPVKLSEVADTVVYLPLETGSTLIENRPQIYFTSRHIIANRSVFDLDGRYVCNVGRKGQGPGEDYIGRMIEKPDAYYSVSSTKLIAYDLTGRYAGKERLIPDLLELDFANAGDNVVLGASLLDTILFFDTNFDVIKVLRTVPPWPENTTLFNVNRNMRLFTQNNDSVLFYNYANDTVFRVLDSDISPRWTVELKEDKVPLKHLLGDEWARLSTGVKHYTNSDLESWDYLKETDNKIRAFSIYETEHFLIIGWLKLKEFWQVRNVEPTPLQVAYYDRRTGQTIAVEGEGFIDDMSSLGVFYPLCGTHGDYMATYYWPFDLREKVESLQADGKPVDKNLLELLSVVKDDDNPVLVMVHLK